jgi:O-antigen/teichoic acid export membrane protein
MGQPSALVAEWPGVLLPRASGPRTRAPYPSQGTAAQPEMRLDPGIRGTVASGLRMARLLERTEDPARRGAVSERLSAAMPSRVRDLGTSDVGRAAGMAAAVMVQNVVALIFTVAFAHILGATGYGSLSAILAAFLILMIPGTALQVTVAREVSAAMAVGEQPPGPAIRSWMRVLTIGAGVVLIVSLLLRDVAAQIIHVDTKWAAGAVLPTGALWLTLCVQRGVLQGLHRYRLVAASLIGESIARLVFSLILVGASLHVTGAFLGTTASILAMSLFLGVVLHQELERAPAGHTPPPNERLRALVARAWAPLLSLAFFGVLQNVDVIVVKHRIGGDTAGSYAAAVVAAKVIIWTALGLGMYLLPEASRRVQLGEDARPVLVRTMGLVLAAAVPMTIVYFGAGHLLLEKVFGAKLTAADSALPILGLAMTALALTYLATQYLLALRRSAFIVFLGVAAVLDPILLSLVDARLTSIAVVLLALQAVLAVVVTVVALRAQALREFATET